MPPVNSPSSEDTTEIPALPANVPLSPDPARVEIEIGAASHIGLVRSVNEDSYYVGRLERHLQTIATNLVPPQHSSRLDEVVYGFLVADGLGGAKAGEVASQLAIDTFIELVLHTPDWIMRVGEAEADRILERIADRYRRVGAVVAELAASDASLAGMGTTLTLACNCGTQLFLGHVGDSRAYLFRGTEIVRLTRDHTYGQALADAGMITQEEADRHRMRHVLTRAIGSQGTDVAVEVSRTTLQDGDIVIVCTDGLTTMVSDETIRDMVQQYPAQEACDRLIEAALLAGGKDNVTVVLGRYRVQADR